MGREQRRREEKKNKNIKNIEIQEELDTSIKGITVLKVVSSIILILLVVYYILAVFVTKEIDISETKNNNTSDTTTTEVTNKILAANIFNQSEDSYYVYCYDFNNEDEGLKDAMNGLVNKTVYRLDTSSSYNSKYIATDTGNKNAKKLDDIKIADPTLLIISEDSIVGYYEGRIDIMNYIGEPHE